MRDNVDPIFQYRLIGYNSETIKNKTYSNENYLLRDLNEPTPF